MLAVKNFFLPEKKNHQTMSISTTPQIESSQRFSRMPEAFMRSIRRRSMRVKRGKSAVTLDRDKRKSDSYTKNESFESEQIIKVGIVGSSDSGKASLIQKFLGVLNQSQSRNSLGNDENFKTEIRLDNNNYSLLITNKIGEPDLEFALWVDAIIFVFSLENEESFSTIKNYCKNICQFRNSNKNKIILVGTQDGISDKNPRLIDETDIKRLLSDLNICNYYETCSKYRINVDKVFYDACRNIVDKKFTPIPNRPNSRKCIMNSISSPSLLTHSSLVDEKHKNQIKINNDQFDINSVKDSIVITVTDFNENNMNKTLSSDEKENHPSSHFKQSAYSLLGKENNGTTAILTPLIPRKSRRRSNLFQSSAKKNEEKFKNEEIGLGRSIPIKQGYLYKKCGKSLNKEWKKKYVTLCDNGCLTYHSSLYDYIENVHGKDIPLQLTTVKVPGQNPRGSKTILTASNNVYVSRLQNFSSDPMNISKDLKKATEKCLFTAFDTLRDPIRCEGEEFKAESLPIEFLTPNPKKRNRRTKRYSSLKPNNNNYGEYEDLDGFELNIISMDNRQWCFEATSSEERDEWVAVIEQEIFKCLQGVESKPTSSNDIANMAIIRTKVPGNSFCVDCNTPNPEWASLNLGVLICIECAGIHRNMGSHISKVRSLDLDDWTSDNLNVMLAMGNKLANSIWESNIGNKIKPKPNSTREEKENWIRSKYEIKEFMSTCNQTNSKKNQQQLIETVVFLQNCLY